MNLRIRSFGFSVTDALAKSVRRPFSTALRHGRNALAQVTVRLRDVNGPRRGGINKRCGVELRFVHGSPVVLNETDSDLFVAIDRAASRSKQTLLDRLRRIRSRRRARRPHHNPLTRLP